MTLSPPSWTTVGSRTKTRFSRFAASTARPTITYSSLAGIAAWVALVGKASPVGVGAGVKKGKAESDLHSGTQVGQSDKVR